MKKYLYYIESSFNFPCYMFHELCHWIFYFITWLLGFNSFPVIIIDRWYKYDCVKMVNGVECVHTLSIYAYVNFNTSYKLIARIGAFMPVIGIVLLILFSPWYMYFYYLSQISSLWLSTSDTRWVLGTHSKLESME